MTDKVMPSFGRTARSREYTAALAYGAGSADGVVWDDGRLVEDSEGDLAAGSLNAFAESHSSSSFDVTIDTGEAIVRGAYLARDTQTTYTLPSSSTTTIYLGWRDGQADTVVIGESGDFKTHDPYIPIWTFDTDGSGVTSVTDERDLATQGYIGKDAIKSAVRGVSYIQSMEPSSPQEHVSWYDTDSGIYRVYADDGDGLDWHPIPPVTVTEEASTFSESDNTLSHNMTTVYNGSVKLIDGVFVDDWEDGDISGWSGDTGSLSNQTSTVLTGSYTGELNSNNAYKEVTSPPLGDIVDPVTFKIRMDDIGPSTADGVAIFFNNSSGTQIGYLDFPDGSGDINWYDGDSNNIGSWSANTTYEIVMNWDFDENKVQIYIDGTDVGTYGLDNSVSGFDHIEFQNDTNSDAFNRNAYIDHAKNPKTSGDIVVSWPSPNDIKSWDLATFQRTLDNETVTIDVLDGSGSVLYSDISQNFDISTVDASKDVQLRANISRSSTSNNPTLDYTARRFTR